MLNKTDIKSDDIEGTLGTAQSSAESINKVADELADCDGDADTKLVNKKNTTKCQHEETSESSRKVNHQNSDTYCRKRSCSELVAIDALGSVEYTGNLRRSSTSVLNASDNNCCLNTKRQSSEESNDRKDHQYQSNLINQCISNSSNSPAMTNTSISNEINSNEEIKNIADALAIIDNSETCNNRSPYSKLTDIILLCNQKNKEMNEHVSRTLSQRRPKLNRQSLQPPVKRCGLSLPTYSTKNHCLNGRFKIAKSHDSSDDSSVIVLSSRESSPLSIDLERRKVSKFTETYPSDDDASSSDYYLNNISPVYSDDGYDYIADYDQEYDDFDNFLFASLPRIECEDTKSIPSASSISSTGLTSPSCYDSLDDSAVMVVQSSESSDESQSVIFLSSRESSPPSIDLLRIKAANVINTCQQSTTYDNKLTDDDPLLVDHTSVEATEEIGCCDASADTPINKNHGSTKSSPNKNASSAGSHKSFSEDSDNRDY